jgi:hypothetical protein
LTFGQPKYTKNNYIMMSERHHFRNGGVHLCDCSSSTKGTSTFAEAIFAPFRLVCFTFAEAVTYDSFFPISQIDDHHEHVVSPTAGRFPIPPTVSSSDLVLHTYPTYLARPGPVLVALDDFLEIASGLV